MFTKSLEILTLVDTKMDLAPMLVTRNEHGVVVDMAHVITTATVNLLSVFPYTDLRTLSADLHTVIAVDTDNREAYIDQCSFRPYDNPRKLLLRWTNAPERYDGFGTATVQKGVHNWRLIIVEQLNREWQAGRYASGLFTMQRTVPIYGPKNEE